ncbi:uncharacterized protein CG45076-like [Haliotis rufescens]|uniref:uncharacterized protein CG45076-like n=1 Tax=Haliotis rufescens TaxID=6454 RepID=UPI001EB0309D|nr:uncharacterized protein CG45076-like [Haliotis rufescens]
MIFLHGLALAVYEVQRYLKYRHDQRLEMLRRDAALKAAAESAAQNNLMIANAMEAERLAAADAAEKAKVAAAVADAEYAAWKEALIAAALEAERVSAYLRKNAGTPAAFEANRLAAVATEKAHSAAAAMEAERVAAAAARIAEDMSAAVAANLAKDEVAAGAVADVRADAVLVKQEKPKKKGLFGGMKTGFML